MRLKFDWGSSRKYSEPVRRSKMMDYKDVRNLVRRVMKISHTKIPRTYRDFVALGSNVEVFAALFSLFLSLMSDNMSVRELELSRNYARMIRDEMVEYLRYSKERTRYLTNLRGLPCQYCGHEWQPQERICPSCGNKRLTPEQIAKKLDKC